MMMAASIEPEASATNNSPEYLAIERTRAKIISLLQSNTNEAATQLSEGGLLPAEGRVNDPKFMVKSVLGRVQSDPASAFNKFIKVLRSLDATTQVVKAVLQAYFGTPLFGEDKRKSIILEKKPIRIPLANNEQLQKTQAFLQEIVVLLVTIKDDERWAAVNYMDPPRIESECLATKPILWHDSESILDVTLGMFGGHKAALIQAKMGDDCRKEVEDALNLMPTVQLVVALGFAYGSNKCSAGDVLVSTTIDGVGNVKSTNGKLIFSEGDNRLTRMERRCSVFAKEKDAWCVNEKFKCSKEGREPKIFPGLLISAPWLVNDKALLEKLFDNDPEAIGGEMEGQVIAGIYNDFRTRSHAQARRLDIVIIKGVADFADGDKTDMKQWQLTAAMAAASYTRYKLCETEGNYWIHNREPKPKPKSDHEPTKHETSADCRPHSAESELNKEQLSVLNQDNLPSHSDVATTSGTSSIKDQLSLDDLQTIQTRTWGVRARWHNFGVALGLSANTLDALRETHKSECDNCYPAVLKMWLKGDGSQPTWNVLCEALKSPLVGYGMLANELHQNK